MDEWRPIVGHPSYLVNRYGQIKHIKSEKPRKPDYHKSKGYPTVTVRVKGRCKHIYCHIAVAEAFIGPREGRTVNHKDLNVFNPHKDNLEYLTLLENIEHAKKLARYKLRKDKVRKVKDELESGRTCEQVANKFDVELAIIRNIKHGKIYAWVK